MYLSDLSVVLSVKPDLVISLTEASEMANPMGEDLRVRGIEWAHLPICDYAIPDQDFLEKWPDFCTDVVERLKNGQSILLHCKGGCGRAGMVALRLMIIMGEDPMLALERLRKVRPCAIETEDQMRWAMEG